MTWLNRVHFGDCRKVMKAWPAASCDACVTDPPYGDTSLSWDKRCDGWMEQVARVLKPAAAVWVFGSMRYLATILAEMERAGFRYAQDIVWEKQNGTGLHNDRFRRVHEHAIMFYRGQWNQLHHEAQYTDDATARTIRRRQKPQHWRKIDEGSYTKEDGGPRLMRSVLYVRNEHGRALHATQKPLGILDPLIRYSVPRGGVVVDPFIGSLSTGIAAQLSGRQWVGCELDEACRAMHEERLRQIALPLEPAT